jgi:hypothetical protein
MFEKVDYRTLPVVVIKFTDGLLIAEVLRWIDFLKGFDKSRWDGGHLCKTVSLVHLGILLVL